MSVMTPSAARMRANHALRCVRPGMTRVSVNADLSSLSNKHGEAIGQRHHRLGPAIAAVSIEEVDIDGGKGEILLAIQLAFANERPCPTT